MNRRTRIVATIGPATQDESILKELILTGVDIARLNFSHGDHKEHRSVFQSLRRIADEINRPLTILQDLQGPKIRVGNLVNGQVHLEKGQELILTTFPTFGNEAKISIDFPDVIPLLLPDHRILLDDGNLELLVTSVSHDHVTTRVIQGGILRAHKGVNFPGITLDIPGFTTKDEFDLAFGLQLPVDAIAVSFVRSEKDINKVRQAIERYSIDSKNLPIIAKIERPESLENLEAIIQTADGVMVARGDLGVEMPPEEVPIAQKRIIEIANRYAKVVITATQMLESMIHNPRPTRAEASDVANAIFDGTDAVMLSGETALGKFPLKTVTMMNAIICQAESNISDWGRWKGSITQGAIHDDTFYMTKAAGELAHDRNVAAIAVFTETGRTARVLSKSRPAVPIIAFTPNEDTYRRLNLYWGVEPFLIPLANTIEEMLEAIEETIICCSPVSTGQQVVLICGYPIQQGKPTNLALLHTIGGTH